MVYTIYRLKCLKAKSRWDGNNFYQESDGSYDLFICAKYICAKSRLFYNPKKFYIFRSHLSSGQCELIKVQPAELPQANFPGKPPIHLIHFLTFVKDLCTPWIVSNSADLNSIVKAFCLWIKYFGRLVQIQTTVSFVGQVLSSHVCPVLLSHWPNFDAGS